MNDFTKIKLNPTEHFAKPADVLSCEFSNKEKFELLKQWEYDLREMQVAEEENMQATQNDTNLDDVLNALNKLNFNDSTDTTHASKHGM